MEDKFKAYLLECLTTGKIYVGITTQTLKKRLSQHKIATSKTDTKIGRHLRKYGTDLTITHIASSLNFELLLELETILIVQYNSKLKGLNSTDGGQGVIGHKHSEESKNKMKLHNLAIWKVLGYREKMVEKAKIGWANKSQEELLAHKRRAAKSMAIAAKNRIRSKKDKVVRYKHKGWNMKIITHCPSGHEYNFENTRYKKCGGRVCIICKRKTRNIARDTRRAKLAKLKLESNNA